MVLSNITLPSLTLSASSNVFYIPEVVFLVVAGGGGGGNGVDPYNAGGGGGAGGVTSGYFNVSAVSTTATITVGQGGIKGVYSGTTPTAGSSSSLTYNSTTYLSTGGGAGAVGLYPSGGTGGTSGNGFLPGSHQSSSYGGTGGGASANGYSNPGSAQGGPGIYYPRFTLWGTDSTNSIIPSIGKGYFGGGGGASGWYYFYIIGPGGVGGGGAGGNSTSAGDGLSNTGGGGGGGGAGAYGPISGGAGAAGIVIVTYPDSYPAAASTTGSPTITVTNGFRYYAFTSSGSITF
jgi:hypothetical protein